MQGIWLGQAGFLFTAEDGMTVMIDPYMSNLLEERDGPAFHRQVPIRPEFIKTPDVLVLTHCHDDHMDLATLDQIFGEKRMTVLAPANVWPVLRSRSPPAPKSPWVPSISVPPSPPTLTGKPSAWSSPATASASSTWATASTTATFSLTRWRTSTFSFCPSTAREIT